jgi:hypothetical protein
VKLFIDEDFKRICATIVAAFERSGEASLRWSDDEYQSRNFCGGWDEEARRFAFSFYAPDGGDYLFTFSVDDARLVAAGGAIEPQLTYWKAAPPLLE